MFQLPQSLDERDWLHETPLGPVWSVDASELAVDLDRTMLVRRLRAPTSFLTVGAVLRLAADNDGAHTIAPSFWSLGEDDSVWIAQRLPPGRLLASVEFSPLGWADALSCWRPLAESIAVGHRNGAIVGSITPWNVWVDFAAGRVVVADCGTWIGDDIPTDDDWWPVELRMPSGQRRPGPSTDVAGLARLLLFMAFGTITRTGIPAYAIGGIDRALSGIAGDRPQRVSELVTALSPAPTRGARVDATSEGQDVLYGRAFDVEQIDHPKLGSGIKFHLTYPEYDEWGAPIGHQTTGTFFYEGRGRDVYESVRDVWEGAEVNLLDAARIADSQGTPFFTGQPATLPVLEPHWPVTVTNTLKAEGCVSKYFVDLRDGGESSRALVFGSLLHSMLDDIATAGDALPSFEQSWEAHLPRMRIAMLAANLTDDHIEPMRQEARQHFTNIAGFAKGRDAARSERVGWSGENVEVTRYSSVYGLEGRIDLVTEDARAGLHIVELKSGFERDEHASQVRCYRLLWDPVAERLNLPIHGYLLYSRSGLMRSAPTEDPMRERRILRARNQLVAAQKAIAEGDDRQQLPYYLMIPSNCHAFCKFRKDRCRQQSLLLGIAPDASADAAREAKGHPWEGYDASLVEDAWLYWHHFERLLELENWEEGERLGRILQSGRLRERLAAHEAIAGLSLARIDPANGEVEFRGEVPRVFMPGDSVVAHRDDFHAEHILRGHVVELTPQTLRIATLGAPNAAALSADGWVVDSLPFRSGHRAAIRAMYAFLARRDDRLLRIVLQPRSAQARKDCSVAGEVAIGGETAALLNSRQIEAVQHGLGTLGGCLIQGPPGTGKTTVIAHIVRELLSDGQRVIVSAQTNTAVDTMLHALLDVGVRDFVRIGHAARSDGLVTHLADLGEDPLQFFSEDVGRATPSLDRLGRRLRFAGVIASTTHKAVTDNVVEYLRRDQDVPFDVAIVDEATQLSEPMTLAPLRLARRFVLVGDHRQLPPIVANERATTAAVDGYAWFGMDDDALSEDADAAQLGLFGGPAGERPRSQKVPMGLGGLDRSMFERLVDQGLPYVMLEEQYRMNEPIQAFSSAAYYAGRLTPHATVAGALLSLDEGALRATPEHLQAVLAPQNPVVFCHVGGEDVARTNAAEAACVVQTVAALIACGAGQRRDAIGVVTPFRAQGQLIRRLLMEHMGEDAARVDVDTVERYQGSERDTIVVSLVKTDHAGEFLSDHRRVNVTLTRARRKLIIFGHRECLMLSPLFREVIMQEATTRVAWSP